MKELLASATEYSVILIDGIALLAILFGTVQVSVRVLYRLFGFMTNTSPHDIWLQYARWLVAGLTFQLAADIIETSITSDWTAVGRIAAIAVIRTFLNYFLERDLLEARQRQYDATSGA